jgi:hypothetical protein
MDIFDQVEEIIKKMETREKKNQTGRLLDEGLILEEMSRRYRQHIEGGQWEKAQECLGSISRLVVAILSS